MPSPRGPEPRFPFGEASLVARLTPSIQNLPMLDAYADQVALGIVVLGITITSIIFGELVPKRIALHYPETMATLISIPLQWLSAIIGPFVRLLSAATDGITRLLGIRQPREDTPTGVDITGMMEEGRDAGVFEKTGSPLVRAFQVEWLPLRCSRHGPQPYRPAAGVGSAARRLIDAGTVRGRAGKAHSGRNGALRACAWHTLALISGVNPAGDAAMTVRPAIPDRRWQLPR
jgi:hypothetical protein